MHDRIDSQRSKEGAEAAAILYCLGNFRLCAVEDGADLAPRGRKARALVAYLVLNGGAVSRERLAGLLWSERGEDQARASLRNTLLELRALSSNGHSVLVVDREHVGVASGRMETDLGRLLAWAASGNLAAIDECLGSWDGRILGDLDSIDSGFDEWLAGERTRQQEKMFAAVIAALEAAPGSDGVEHARSIADKLLQIEPTNEVIVRLAMRADHSAQDVSAIRRRYKRLESQLRTEFNAAPSADTRRLYDELVAGSSAEDHASAAATAPGNEHAEPTATAEVVPEASPARASSFSPWRWAAAAVMVVAVGAAAIAVTASYEWESPHTVDLVELRPLFVLDGAFEGLAQQTHGTLKRVLASHQVAIVDGVTTASSSERPTKAEFALSGSLEDAGSQVSVTLYLDNVQDGQTLWSHRFARASGERERLRDEVSAHAAFVLECALRQRRLARVRPTVAAFKIYLETCDPAFVWGEMTVLAVAQRLVEVAPEDAYGHRLLAFANVAMVDDPNLPDAEARVFRDRARKAAARASELDPTSPLPLLANALTLPFAESWQERETHLRRARADYPILSDNYVHHLRASGRVTEAMRVLELSLAQLPLSAKSRTFVAVLHMQLGDHARADALFNKAIDLWPTITVTRWYRFVNLAFYGKPDDALGILSSDRDILGFTPDVTNCWQTFIEARRANGPGIATVRTACADLGDYVPRMLATLGDVNGAFEAMRANRMDWNGATVAFFYPEMKTVRHDVRFMSTIADSGLVGYWTASGQWPDFCSDKDLPYSCKDAAADVLRRKNARTVQVPD